MKKTLIIISFLLVGMVVSFLLAESDSSKLSVMNTHQTNNEDTIVRPAAQAGRFYDGNPHRLAAEVDSFLANHKDLANETRVAAIIAPHAGYYFSGNVAAAAYAAVGTAKRYKRIFLLGPSHYEWIDGASVNCAYNCYATPLGKVPVDRETGAKLLETDSVFQYVPAAHDREHCLEVQIPFLQRRLGDVPPIVPIVVNTNRLDKLRRIAEALRPFFNEDNLFVISSDFSHYPSYADAYKVDERTKKAVLSGDVEKFFDTLHDNAASGIRQLDTSACGAAPIAVLLLLADGKCDIRHLCYQNSGDVDNYDPNRVVGYHAFAVYRKGLEAADGEVQDDAFSLSKQEKEVLKAIAFNSLKESFGMASEQSGPLTPTLKRKCGAFVTLHKRGRLRGCIGHFGEDTPLHELVAEMAKAAAFEDPRFTPLTRDELDKLTVEISVLTPMRRIHSIDEFQLHRHGIYMRKGMRSGTFLPQVADEVDWTKEEFLGHCARDKAGLGWDGWRNAELYVYEAIVF